MELQVALDLMRRIKDDPKFRTGAGAYFYEARVVTEDGEDFKVEVRYDEDYPETLTVQQAHDRGYLATS